MAKPSKYTLSNLAARDIRSIAEYGEREWSTDVAEAYVTALHQQFDLLVLFPKIGPEVETTKHIQLRRWRYKSHLVFYKHRQDKQDIFIVRVFHTSQNYYAYFN